MNLDEIHLSLGVGDFKFGITINAVIAVLGNTYIKTTDEFGDIEIECKELALRFEFWKEGDFRLGIISTARAESILYGEHLIGKSKKDLRYFIQHRLNGVISEKDGCIHEDGHIQEWIEVDDKNVCFWFRNDVLYLIDCFCPWIDNNTPQCRIHPVQYCVLADRLQTNPGIRLLWKGYSSLSKGD